jgi:hypothetical protein
MRTSAALLPLLASCSACVVPTGPEWTDPESNYPPTIYSASPAIGSILTQVPDAGWPLAVVVRLADQNTNDDLYVRWLIDYPPYDETISRLGWETIQPGNGQSERPELSFAPNCNEHHIAPGVSRHRLLLAASDRSFAPGPAISDLVPEGNFRAEALWLFDLDCP